MGDFRPKPGIVLFGELASSLDQKYLNFHKSVHERLDAFKSVILSSNGCFFNRREVTKEDFSRSYDWCSVDLVDRFLLKELAKKVSENEDVLNDYFGINQNDGLLENIDYQHRPSRLNPSFRTDCQRVIVQLFLHYLQRARHHFTNDVDVILFCRLSRFNFYQVERQQRTLLDISKDAVLEHILGLVSSAVFQSALSNSIVCIPQTFVDISKVFSDMMFCVPRDALEKICEVDPRFTIDKNLDWIHHAHHFLVLLECALKTFNRRLKE